MNVFFRQHLFLLILSGTLAFATVLTGCEGPAGTEGPQGERGPAGPIGPAGEDGSMMYAGEGVPGEDIGTEGDFYLDQNTGELYGPKDADGWGDPIIVLMGEDGQDGADGQDGEDGSRIYAGSGAPDVSLGTEGDYYLDKDNYELYGPKTSGGWGLPLNLKGADGNANVTLYIFDAPAFTSTEPSHTVTISGLSFADFNESSWSIFFKRGAFKQFIPGKISWGIPPSEFTVAMLYDNSTGNLEFRIELIDGSDYYPDEIHIFRTVPESINDNRPKHVNISGMDASPKFVDYDSLIKYYRLEKNDVMDMRR